MNHPALQTAALEPSGATRQVPAAAWWRFGYVWLILAGPALAVVASFATLYLAITRPDPEVARPAAAQATAATINGHRSLGALAPAVQGRNHAATGVPAPAVPVSASR